MTEAASERALAGIWVAYHSDWSGLNLFAREIDALRHAVDHHMDGVVFVPNGQDPREVVLANFTRQRSGETKP